MPLPGMTTSQRVRRSLRNAALSGLKAGGLFHFVGQSDWRRQRLLILCYHGVAIEDEHEWRPALYIRPQQLERRLEILQKAKCTVLPLGEALERLRRNELPPRSVAITFDDGPYDFYRQSYPRLKQFGFPATVYLTTYYSELQCPIFQLICSYMLWKARGKETLDLKELGVQEPVNLASPESRQRAAVQIVQWADAQNFTGKQKNEIAARLAERLSIDYQELVEKRILQIMNAEEVKELAAAGVDFQLHSHRHRSPLKKELFRKEIRDNREHLARIIPGVRTHYCYPSGAYRTEFGQWLAGEGVISATTCDAGFATADGNPLLLPRFVDTSGRSDLEFESWVGGVGHFLSFRKRAKSAYVPD